eukprot:15480853-Alexandrium_andersonii.AAC.1
MAAGAQRGAQAQPRRTARKALRNSACSTRSGEESCAEQGTRETMKVFHWLALTPAELCAAVMALAL